MTCVDAFKRFWWTAVQGQTDNETPNQASKRMKDYQTKAESEPAEMGEVREVPEMRWVTGTTLQQLTKDFRGQRSGYVRVGEKGWLLPGKYAVQAPHYLNFKPRSDDVWVVTYPRSGTTLTQEMSWLIANDLDFKTAREVPLNDRFPFFEFSAFIHEDTKREFLEMNARHPERQRAILDMTEPGYELLARAPGRRFIKTHFPFSLLPGNLLTSGAKVIYVARNPKDVAVSFYHLNRLILTQGFQGNFETFWNYFQNDLSVWAPYWSHIEEGWQRRAHPNVLFMFYEDIRRDTPAAILNTANFLGKHFEKDQVIQLADHLSIYNFRKNPAVNSQDLYELGIMRSDEESFIRKGKTGGWMEYFSSELRERAEKWIDENLARTDLRFPPQ